MICNKRAKIAINEEKRIIVPFPFTLHSPYVEKDQCIFSEPKEIYNQILLYYILDYFLNRHSIKVEKIDWQSRERAYRKLPSYLNQ